MEFGGVGGGLWVGDVPLSAHSELRRPRLRCGVEVQLRGVQAGRAFGFGFEGILQVRTSPSPRRHRISVVWCAVTAAPGSWRYSLPVKCGEGTGGMCCVRVNKQTYC